MIGWFSNLERSQTSGRAEDRGRHRHRLGHRLLLQPALIERRKDSKSRIIVLLTGRGESNLGKISPLTAADAAKALGVKVYTIAAGVDGYAPFPVRDPFGRKVYTKIKADVDVDTSKKIAATTDGKFYRATDAQKLNQIFDEIDKLEKSTVETKQFTEYQELFPWLLGTGLGLLSLQALLAQTIGNRLP